ncbi:hypothetical protein K0M31_013509, partial [Melipona bicolor]
NSAAIAGNIHRKEETFSINSSHSSLQGALPVISIIKDEDGCNVIVISGVILVLEVLD